MASRQGSVVAQMMDPMVTLFGSVHEKQNETGSMIFPNFGSMFHGEQHKADNWDVESNHEKGNLSVDETNDNVKSPRNSTGVDKDMIAPVSRSMLNTDINECDDKSNLHCFGRCIIVNIAGSYNCTCWPGYTGDAKIPHGCRPISNGSKIYSHGIHISSSVWFPGNIIGGHWNFLWHNVAYPFGIGVGSGCSIDESFDLTCNTTYDPPKLFTLVQLFDLRLFCLDCFLM
ncbi:putative EGF-like domain-containing protein [Helianthus annuus]|nr:putative EGF-like domain-containing protein [Helianthus annuus]